jgi:hypothetical protein
MAIMHFLRYFLNDGMFLILTHLQPGVPRTKENTLAELKKQVELACGGVAKRVQELQTETGVKDVYTQYWIEVILARAVEMRQEDAIIKSKLLQWARASEEKLYSPFLTMKDAQFCRNATCKLTIRPIGFDPASDTPVELLHTILLGAGKYIWHIWHTPWSNEKNY